MSAASVTRSPNGAAPEVSGWKALPSAVERALGLGLGLGLLGTVVVGALWPSFVWLLPLLLVGSAALIFIWSRPAYHLAAVLFGFVVVFDYSEGIQAQEVVFGLYYLSYLAGWFAYHTFVRRTVYVRGAIDAAVLAYLIVATASLALIPLFGNDPVVALSQWTGVVVLGYYFPIKQAVARSPRVLASLLLVFGALVVVVTLRNFLLYYEALQSAEALWQIMQNRARTNERQIMVGLIGGLVFLLYYARSWPMKGAFVAFCFTLTAGVIAGQSRAVWVSMVLALGVMLMMIERQQRVRLLAVVGGAAAMLLAVGFIAFSGIFEIILEGLATRFGSLGTAATQDSSLVNRFFEWRVVLERVTHSPIFGLGLGAEYRHFSLIFNATHVKHYVHNTYIGVLYRHGLLGLALFLVFFAGSFVRGLGTTRALRGIRTESGAFAAAMACTAALPALALAAMTEGLMLNADGVFVVMYPIAILAGIRQRSWSGQRAVPPSAPR